MRDISKTKAQLLVEIKNLRKKLDELEGHAASDAPAVSADSTQAAPKEHAILVVDDSSIVRSSLERDIKAAGYAFIEAESGEKALEKLAENPSLVLLDMHMESMDGLETLQAIRENPDHGGIPVIMLTAMSEIENRLNCFAAGADDYLLKPYLKKELLIRIKRLLEVRELNLDLKKEIDRHKASAQALNEIAIQQGLDKTALAESEKNFRAIFDKAPAGVAILDTLSGKFLKVNEKYTEIVGCGSDELLTTNFQAITHPDDIEPDLAGMKKLIDGSIRQFAMDKRYIRKDGSIVWVNLTCVPLWEKPSDPKQHLAIVIDITERKKFEEGAKRASDEWRTTFDSMTDLIMLLDKDQNIIKANKMMMSAFGGSFEKLLGHKCFERVHEDGKKPENCPNEKTLGDGHSHTIEGRICGRDYLISTAPIRTNGAVSGTVHIMKDVSELKKLEQEFAKMEKLEAVGLLAGGIAHDFNNILMALWGNVQLALLNTEPDAPNMEILGESEKACRRARDLTYQLLTFAKGGQPICKIMNLDPFLRESAGFALSGSKSRPVYDIADDLRAVNADEGQLNQVISNLVINASQAMPGGGEIEISADNFVVDSSGGHKTLPLSDGNYLRIRIQDHGVGIGADLLQKIFDPYFTTKKTGSGLGLASSYSIVKKHDGHIDVSSVPDQGSLFTVYLPASDEKTAEHVGEGGLLKGSGRILIMDDDETVLNVVSEILKKLGYRPEFSKDGDEAVAMFAKARGEGTPYDAVILDLTIPGGMGGIECFEKFIEMDPNVKAIVSSGYSNDPIMANYKKYGFRGVLSKPYRIDEVGKTLKSALV